MDWLQVVVLSLIQGLTEFLPISSSAHLILPAELSDWPDQGLAFDVAVHFGTLMAVIAYFYRDLLEMGQAVLRFERSEETDLVFKLAIATIPVVIAGFLLKDFVEAELRTVHVIAFTTIGFGVVLWFADRRQTDSRALTWTAAALIGCAQVLALVPGTSRSGITITAALLLGLSRTRAAQFSFMLAIPTIAGAQVLTAADLLTTGVDTPIPQLLTGMLLAGVSAYLCIRFFIALVERTGMLPYVIYRIALGVVLLIIAA